MDRPHLSIVGSGIAGTSFGILAARAGWTVAGVGGRNARRAMESARQMGDSIRSCSIREAAGLGDIVLLTVSDDSIESVCNELVDHSCFREGASILHCSGALSSAVLASAKQRLKCTIGSAHPLQTFPNVESALAKIPKSYCFCEGDATLLPSVQEFLKSIGLRQIQIDEDAKVLYHAAAVIACNYFVSLLDISLEVGESAGIQRDVFLDAVEPLVAATLQNVTRIGVDRALTGPIARGDIQTVRKHLAALSDMNQGSGPVWEAYHALGVHTTQIAARRGSIDTETMNLLRTILGAPRT